MYSWFEIVLFKTVWSLFKLSSSYGFHLFSKIHLFTLSWFLVCLSLTRMDVRTGCLVFLLSILRPKEVISVSVIWIETRSLKLACRFVPKQTITSCRMWHFTLVYMSGRTTDGQSCGLPNFLSNGAPLLRLPHAETPLFKTCFPSVDKFLVWKHNRFDVGKAYCRRTIENGTILTWIIT